MNFLLYFLFFGSYTRKNALYHKARYSNTSFHFAANEKLGHSHYVDTFPSDNRLPALAPTTDVRALFGGCLSSFSNLFLLFYYNFWLLQLCWCIVATHM